MSHEYDMEVPPGCKRGFLASVPEHCKDCGGWKGYVGQVNEAKTHARAYCATPCLPTAELAEEHARNIADALETQRMRQEILSKTVTQTIGAVEAIKRGLG